MVFGFFLVVGIANERIAPIMVFSFALLCLAVGCYRLWKELYLPKLVLGALAVPLGGLWLVQSFARIVFVIREGGMERADGYGSPLAFLIGVVSEWFLLGLPAILLAIIIIWHRNPTRPNKASRQPENTRPSCA